MDNPFKYLSEAFRDDFEVRFVIERMDGSLVLVLSDGEQVRVRRALTGDQLGDVQKLEQVVQSIRFGLAIDSGLGYSELERMAAASQDYHRTG